MNPGDALSPMPQERRDEPTGKPSRLRDILEKSPEARPRIGRAVAALLGTALVALAALTALLIWHLIRRGRIIRERLGEPRVVRLPDFPERNSVPPPSPSLPEVDGP